MTGKPYSGKLNVRFDEGELEIGHCYYASSLLYLYASLLKRSTSLGFGLGRQEYWTLAQEGRRYVIKNKLIS